MKPPGVNRLWRGLLCGILLAALLVIATAAYFTATSSGLRQLLALSQRWLPGELRVEHIEGSLFGTLALQGVHWRHPDFSLSLQRLDLDWQPGALLGGTLHIRRLEATQPVIRLTAAATPPAATVPMFPITLPDMTLPLQLRIEAAQLRELAFYAAPTTEGATPPPTVISAAQLQLHSEQQTIILEQLKIVTPQAQGQLHGRLSPSGELPLQLTAQWQLSLPGYPSLQGHGVLAGNRNALRVKQQLSGLLDARLTASLQHLLDSPQGTLHIEESRLDLGHLSAPLKGHSLSGSLQATGNLQGIDLDGRWQANLPQLGDSNLDMQLQLSGEALHIKKLHITHPQTQAEVQLSGDITELLGVPQFDLRGNWRDLHYPLRPEAAYRSPAGQFQLAGTRQQYRLELAASVAGTSLPAGQWSLAARGNDQGFEQFTLGGNTLAGTLQAEGRVRWLPTPSWQLALSGTQLNPARQWPDWPGKLDFHATSTGAQAAQQPLRARLTLDSLRGSLRDQPLEGYADVALNGTQLALQQLRLTVAGAKLLADGNLGKQLDLNWSVAAPDLAQLPGNARGSLSGSGSLHGPAEQVRLKATLQGHNLQLEQQQIANLETHLDVDLSGGQRSTIRLRARQLSIAGNSWQQLTIDGTGTPASHQLQLTMGDGPADLQVALQGSWQQAHWLGTLTRADLQQSQLGSWQLARPVSLRASRGDASIEKLCWKALTQASGALCTSASWSATEGLRGEFDGRQLALKMLAPWMPPGIQINGRLQASAQFQQPLHRRPRLQASAILTDTELRLEEEDIRVVAGEISVNLDAQQNRLTADLRLPLQQPAGNVQARLRVNDLDNARELDGTLNMDLGELQFISLLSPQLQAVKGRIEAALRLSGSAARPRLKGHLRLVDGSTELPELGTRLEAINLSLRDQADSATLLLTGTLRSGEGSLRLDGEFDPLTTRGQLTIDGERFQAIATQEIQAWISPAIKLSVTPAVITLRGEITIPEAAITPPKIDARAPASPDVVILDPSRPDTGTQKARRQAIDARLRFTLGDKVEVDALGFKGLLQGSLLIEDDGRRATRATGNIQVAAGEYRLYGQDLTINRGSLLFSGGPVDNPGLDLQVSRRVEEVTAGAKVRGSLKEPRITLFSEPAMPESNLLSYLLFGRPAGSGSNTPSQQELLFKAVSALTMKGGNALAEEVSDTLRVDELGIDGGDAVGDTSLYIGKYLSPRLYVKYGVGLLEPTNTFFVRYQLSKRWSLETQSGTDSSGGDIIFTLER